MDNAERGYRVAIEADPGDAKGALQRTSAITHLGRLLKNERQDVDGAEKAYRAAIEADPGYAKAHFNLALLLVADALDN